MTTIKNHVLTACVLLLFGCSNDRSTAPDITSTAGSVDLPTHSSANSLDWQGLYRDTLPCADCGGIITEIKLSEEKTFKLAQQYIGKSDSVFYDTGSFSWDPSGNVIRCVSEDKETPDLLFHVGENMLILLDQDGNRILGELAAKYMVHKVPVQVPLLGTKWILKTVDQQEMTASEGKTAQMLLVKPEYKVTGYSGCNQFFGTFTLSDGNSISFSPLAATKRMCLGENAEPAMFSALVIVAAFEIQGTVLKLMDNSDKPIATFTAGYWLE